MNIIFDNPHLTDWQKMDAFNECGRSDFKVDFISFSFVEAISYDADQMYKKDLELCVSFFPPGPYVAVDDLKGDWLRSRPGFDVEAYDWVMDTIDDLERFMNNPQNLGIRLMLEVISNKRSIFIGNYNSINVTKIIREYTMLKEREIIKEAEGYFWNRPNLWHIEDGHVYVAFRYVEKFLWYCDKFFRHMYENVVNDYLKKSGFFGVKALQFDLPAPLGSITKELEEKKRTEAKDDLGGIDLL